MRISFSGTREGMSDRQLATVRSMLEKNASKIVLAAHGNCIGADVQFHKLVRRFCRASVFVAVFPSTSKSTRAPDPRDASYIAPPKPPTERDKTIVSVGESRLIAAPLSDTNVVRSGTWTTVRYAIKVKVPVWLVLRDGTIVEDYRG